MIPLYAGSVHHWFLKSGQIDLLCQPNFENTKEHIQSQPAIISYDAIIVIIISTTFSTESSPCLHYPQI